MNYTVDDLKNMSPEEMNEVSKELAIKAFKKFLLLMTIKWALIFGLSYISRKYIQHLENQ